jgi:hypothetical protein
MRKTEMSLTYKSREAAAKRARFENAHTSASWGVKLTAAGSYRVVRVAKSKPVTVAAQPATAPRHPIHVKLDDLNTKAGSIGQRVKVITSDTEIIAIEVEWMALKNEASDAGYVLMTNGRFCLSAEQHALASEKA